MIALVRKTGRPATSGSVTPGGVVAAGAPEVHLVCAETGKVLEAIHNQAAPKILDGTFHPTGKTIVRFRTPVNLQRSSFMVDVTGLNLAKETVHEYGGDYGWFPFDSSLRLTAVEGTQYDCFKEYSTEEFVVTADPASPAVLLESRPEPTLPALRSEGFVRVVEEDDFLGLQQDTAVELVIGVQSHLAIPDPYMIHEELESVANGYVNVCDDEYLSIYFQIRPDTETGNLHFIQRAPDWHFDRSAGTTQFGTPDFIRPLSDLPSRYIQFAPDQITDNSYKEVGTFVYYEAEDGSGFDGASLPIRVTGRLMHARLVFYVNRRPPEQEGDIPRIPCATEFRLRRALSHNMREANIIFKQAGIQLIGNASSPIFFTQEDETEDTFVHFDSGNNAQVSDLLDYVAALDQQHFLGNDVIRVVITFQVSDSSSHLGLDAVGWGTFPDRIVVMELIEAAQRYDLLAHELGHALGGLGDFQYPQGTPQEQMTRRNLMEQIGYLRLERYLDRSFRLHDGRIDRQVEWVRTRLPNVVR